MKITDGCVVAMEYTLKAEDGSLIDTSEGDEPMWYLHGAGQIVPGLELALRGREVGDEFEAVVKPEDGYGLRRDDKVLTVPRDRLPDEPEPEVGMQLEAQGRRGEQVILWVTDVTENEVTLDGNHPLAGQTLYFKIEVKQVREATADEKQHGHAHGPDAHHHHH